MEPLAGMLFGVVAKPALAGAPSARRDLTGSNPPPLRRRDSPTLLKLYARRPGRG